MCHRVKPNASIRHVAQAHYSVYINLLVPDYDIMVRRSEVETLDVQPQMARDEVSLGVVLASQSSWSGVT